MPNQLKHLSTMVYFLLAERWVNGKNLEALDRLSVFRDQWPWLDPLREWPHCQLGSRKLSICHIQCGRWPFSLHPPNCGSPGWQWSRDRAGAYQSRRLWEHAVKLPLECCGVPTGWRKAEGSAEGSHPYPLSIDEGKLRNGMTMDGNCSTAFNSSRQDKALPCGLIHMDTSYACVNLFTAVCLL